MNSRASSTARGPSTCRAPRGEVAFERRRLRLLADGPLVLDDFNLTCMPGETVAMVGRTASGKTHGRRLLSRFYDVTGGASRSTATTCAT